MKALHLNVENDARRGRLKWLIDNKDIVTAMEAHDRLSGQIVEKTVMNHNGEERQFDAIWISSICNAVVKGKRYINYANMEEQFKAIEDIMGVTTKPIIFDGETGSQIEHFANMVRTFERAEVSMVVISDRADINNNHPLETERNPVQDSMKNFCEKIREGKRVQLTKDFMICARIESLLPNTGMDDAMKRATAYVAAGADAIMIDSGKEEPSELFSFLEEFRKEDEFTPIIIDPADFRNVTEEEFGEHGANVIVYADQLLRAAVPEMKRSIEDILKNH